MREMMERNPDISEYELTENVFGRQGHGRVIGMGTGVRPTHFREDLRGGSQSQKRQAQDYERMRSEIEAKVQAESNTRLQEIESRLQEQANETQRQLELRFENQLAAFMARYPPPPPPDQS